VRNTRSFGKCIQYPGQLEQTVAGNNRCAYGLASVWLLVGRQWASDNRTPTSDILPPNETQVKTRCQNETQLKTRHRLFEMVHTRKHRNVNQNQSRLLSLPESLPLPLLLLSLLLLPLPLPGDTTGSSSSSSGTAPVFASSPDLSCNATFSFFQRNRRNQQVVQQNCINRTFASCFLFRKVAGSTSTSLSSSEVSDSSDAACNIIYSFIEQVAA